MRQQRTRFPSGYFNLPDQVNITDHVVARHVLLGQGSRCALECQQRTLSFSELDAWTTRLGNSLRAAGVARGDRFLIRAPNSLEAAVALLGGMKVGAVALPTDTRLGADRLASILAHSGARLAFTTPELLGPLAEAASAFPALGTLVLLEGGAPEYRSLSEFVGGHDPEPAFEPTSADHPAYILYTSEGPGPLGPVTHAHRAVISAGDPVRYGLLRLTAEDRCLVPDALSSLLALDFSLLFPLAGGARGVLYRGGPDPEEILPVVEASAVTILVAAPAFFRRLCAVPHLGARYDLGSVRLALSAGEPLGAAVRESLEGSFGLEIHEITSRTETHVYAAHHPDFHSKPGSFGVPLPGRNVVILTDDGRRAQVGEIGHLCLPADDPALALDLRDKARSDPPADGHDDWYDVGVLAYWDDDGYLWPADPATT